MRHVHAETTVINSESLQISAGDIVSNKTSREKMHVLFLLKMAIR